MPLKLGVLGIDHGHIFGMLSQMQAQGCTCNAYWTDGAAVTETKFNKVFPDVAMPHALLELQGLAACSMGPIAAANGGIKRDPLTGEDILEDPCGRFDIVDEGALSPAEFDKAVFDLVNFLAYVGEPAALDRQRIGIYSLLFILLFFVFAALLNREYWKDVH